MGLINHNLNSATAIFRNKLNMSNVKEPFSVIEGEVVVAEGFHDMGKGFSVNRILKPALERPVSNFLKEDLVEFNRRNFANQPI